MEQGTDNGHDGFPSDLLVDLRSAAGGGLRERLEHGLRAAIQHRRLVAGTRLPPTRQLASELGVSRSVVVEAYANLKADGYLEARQGASTRVRPDERHAPLPRPRDAVVDDVATFFRRPRGASPSPSPPIRMLGGLPDPALFPRARWLRHYRAALTELPDPELTYPSTRGAPALRSALAAYLGRVRGVDVAHERVLVCGGFTQALALLCRVLARGGARAIAVEDPCFGMHRRVIAMSGLDPIPVAVDEHGLDPAGLERLDVAAVLVAPAHSYPTGGTLDAGRRRALVAWARRRGALVIEDDYDAEFRYDRVAIGALQGLAPEHVAYIGSASKSISPALRLGWIAAPADLADPLEREKRFDDMGCGLLEQLAFARFLDSGDCSRHLRRVRPVYRRRRDAAIAALDELLPDARWAGAGGGLHLHLRLPAGIDERALAIASYERGVLIEPGAWHWARPADAPPSIVVGYGAQPEPALRRGITILAAALAATAA